MRVPIFFTHCTTQHKYLTHSKIRAIAIGAVLGTTLGCITRLIAGEPIVWSVVGVISWSWIGYVEDNTIHVLEKAKRIAKERDTRLEGFK